MNPTTTPNEFTRMRNCFMKRSIFLSLLCVLSAGLIAGQRAEVADQVQALIPRLAEADVSARYAAQMELQDIASTSSQPGHEEARQALGKILANLVADDAVAQPARVWMVRQLEYMGGEESVWALKGLLTSADGELRECARRALEKNPSAAAVETLVGALDQALEGGASADWRIGLLRSVGERGDDRNVALVALALPDPATRPSAARALGAIGTPPAIAALAPLMNQSPAVSLAMVEAANARCARGDLATAREAYRQVFDRSVYPYARAVALAGLVKVDPQGSADRLRQALAGTDPLLRQAALNAAEGMGTSYMPVLADLLSYLSPPAAVQVIGRLDGSVEASLMQTARTGEDSVRIAAIRRLAQVGGAASVGVLLDLATEEGPVGAEARAALVRIPGVRAAETIQFAVRSQSTPVREAALNALVSRELTESVPLLLRCAAERDARISRAALKGLSRMGGRDELLPVARIALDRQSEDAFDALVDIAGRVEEGASAAGDLIKLADGHDRAVVALLDTLGTLGGPEALATVTRFLGGSDADAALGALARWQDLSATEALLKVAADSEAPEARHALALNGALTVIGASADAAVGARADALLAAWAATRNAAEKKRVLGAMAQAPDGKLIPTLKPLLKDDELKAEAAAAAVSVAEGLKGQDKDAATDLAQAVVASDPGDRIRRRAEAVLR